MSMEGFQEAIRSVATTPKLLCGAFQRDRGAQNRAGPVEDAVPVVVEPDQIAGRVGPRRGGVHEAADRVDLDRAGVDVAGLPLADLVSSTHAIGVERDGDRVDRWRPNPAAGG